MRVLAVVPGPDSHGVVRHGLTVAGLVAGRGVEVTVARTLDPPHEPHDLAHVQFTDALFGTEIAVAADSFVAWARTAPRPLVVTLHDVPGTDPDAARDARRRDGYRRVVAAADAVVVSADHEAPRARLVDGVDPFVVPLPVEALAAAGPRPAWAGRPSVAVLGFVYPGKGHDAVLQAVARLADPTVRVVAMGAASPGHEPLLAGLRRQADDLGVELVVTGRLSEEDMHAAALAATVPVAAYRTVGASGSLATWLACGRRPVVRAGGHALELEARRPGSLCLYEDDRYEAGRAEDDRSGLARAVAGALAEPVGTWLSAAPHRPDVAAGHLAVYRSCLS